MGKLSASCNCIPTNVKKSWNYDEYYIGKKDEENRIERGENHWSGAKSLDCYNGPLLANAMHGLGEYRWRHLGPEQVHFTYEGHFYCNRMHGYGTMSYPDGKVFIGLYHSNIRWGPGIESQACLKEDVGLWRGIQLVRLAWRPLGPSIAPDYNSNNSGKTCVDSHRIILATTYKKFGETNSAIELLKNYGSDPKTASEVWDKLYPKNCTDPASLLCNVELFERNYYNEKINMLEEVTCVPEVSDENSSQQSAENRPEITTYFAWNNNKIMVHMMKHCYTHEMQRNTSVINLKQVLSGPREKFKSAGKHEIDCRTLLMASFLGRLPNVIQLINEFGIHPDVADSLGNSAIMYATCGDRTDIIHFLVKAGASVDNYNDSCCTPLAVALLRLICVQKDISPSGIVQASLPPVIIPPPPHEEPKISEWNFNHDQVVIHSSGIARTPSKISRGLSAKKIKSVHSIKELGSVKKKIELVKSQAPQETNSIESFDENKILYHNINSEFVITINDLYLNPSTMNQIPYVFEIHNMIKEISGAEGEAKKLPEKIPKKVPSKMMKDTMKPSEETMWQNTDRDDFLIDSVEKQKTDILAKIMLTIVQLLSDGANPKFVKCPRPALFMAIIAGYPDLVKHLVNSGANINEIYDEIFQYTALDLAVSQPFSYQNFNLIRTILECGATPNRRLQNKEASSTDATPPHEGPTLLHAVLAREINNETEGEIRIALLELLLTFGFNPILQYKGQSAIDVSMSMNMKLLDVFIKCPSINLNTIINATGETVLVKMFSISFFRTINAVERLQTLTNLLLFGADPFLECGSADKKFFNLYVFAQRMRNELVVKPTPITALDKSEPKKAEKSKKDKKEQSNTKSTVKMMSDDIGDYKQAIDLIIECGRLIYVRWLQAKLMKELVEIIDRYKHRPWNMIIKEHKKKNCVRLWLTTQRCLEIWDIMKSTKRREYNDEKNLKYLLHIVAFYYTKTKIVASTKMSAEEKYSIEFSVIRLLKERQIASKPKTDINWKKKYVKPELTPKKDEQKFNVCFECLLPLDEEKIECVSCKVISFCSLQCMTENVDRANCHPCSGYLKLKYCLTSPAESLIKFNN